MLAIQRRRTTYKKRLALSLSAIALLGGGLYMLLLVASPLAAPLLVTKPIDVASLAPPDKTEERIVIPKLGVNIAYGKGKAALDRGAEWRAPNSGNPADGGNFVIAAHRFSIQPTPFATIEKSPFYHIDKLDTGDKILVDYQGKRYGYEVFKKFTVKPTQIEIEAHTTNPTLTLYSCELEGSNGDRLVIEAKRLGEVALK